MKSNELRIGNYVDWNGEKAVISQLLELDVFFKCRETDLYENIKPIPLTEEWLLKFGFEKDIDDLYLDISTMLFVSYSDDEFVHLKSNNLKLITSIKYVHQLQNLYFALTGDELTLKN